VRMEITLRPEQREGHDDVPAGRRHAREVCRGNGSGSDSGMGPRPGGEPSPGEAPQASTTTFRVARG